jgi:carboxyl-terminal processing protease
MSIRSKLTLVMLSGLIAIYAIVGGMLSNSPLGRAIADPGPYPQLRIFEEVVRHIVQDYVEKPDLEKVRVGALRGLTDGLDPYSAYLLPQQVKDYQTSKGKLSDTTGLALGQYRGYAYVIAVTPGSPADKAGIKAGNVIEYIDGHATRDIDLYDMRSLLNGAPGTTVEVAVFRSNATDKIKITRGAVPSAKPEVQSLESQIGYVKVPTLNAGQAAAVEAAVRDAIKRGAQKIILDLRGSAGGEMQEGVAVANYFVKSGTLAKVIGRNGKVVTTYEAKPENVVTDLPVAALVDLSTAGAAEVVAAAIMENQRGDVVGSRSFGVGSEQELFMLDDGSAMLLTTSRYASPTGKFFLPEGVTPNVEVKRADLADASTPEDEEEEQPKTNRTPSPSATPSATPPVVAPQKPAEDLILKKAIEVLTTNAKAKKRAA